VRRQVDHVAQPPVRIFLQGFEQANVGLGKGNACAGMGQWILFYHSLVYDAVSRCISFVGIMRQMKLVFHIGFRRKLCIHSPTLHHKFYNIHIRHIKQIYFPDERLQLIYSDLTSQRIERTCIRNTNCWILLSATIAVYCKNHKKHINILQIKCGFFNIQPFDTFRKIPCFTRLILWCCMWLLVRQK